MLYIIKFRLALQDSKFFNDIYTDFQEKLEGIVGKIDGTVQNYIFDNPDDFSEITLLIETDTIDSVLLKFSEYTNINQISKPFCITFKNSEWQKSMESFLVTGWFQMCEIGEETVFSVGLNDFVGEVNG
jgi:hypothetical protein